jgi:hypothetical protein
VVTPTRLVFPPSVPITTSRMSRMLAGQYSLVVVAFRDENLDKIQNVDEVLAGVEEAIKVVYSGMKIFTRNFPLCMQITVHILVSPFFCGTYYVMMILPVFR